MESHAMRAVTPVLLLSMIGSVQAQQTQNPETLTERSQASARAVLDRAIQALGGTASLRSIEAVRYHFEGQTWTRLQMPTPAAPFEADTQEQTVLLDLDNNRMRADQRDINAGVETYGTVVMNAGTTVNYNHRSRAVLPMAAALGTQQFGAHTRRLPQLLLRQALDNIGTLRHLGREDFAGKPHEVITFVTPQSEQVSVYVDAASNLVSKYELAYVDPLTGDEASEFLFGDYTSTSYASGKQLVPRTWTDRDAGATVASFRVQTEINPALTDTSFEVPHEGYASVEAPGPLEEQVEQLADGVFVLRHIAARNQHSLAVEFKDHILVVEAPGTSAGADKLIARIKTIIPGKPIRYVAITHHHGDHIGGLRSFIAEGATVITTPGNRQLITALAQAPQFDRLREQPRELKLLIIDKGKHVLSDGSRTVELLDIGPNPHARELVVAYLPQQRILFEADVFSKPYTTRPIGPVQPITASFAARVRELDLKVDRIVGVHGLSATSSEFSALTKQKL
jgi:glyoxylase-like metal-dependent hydrolase (beta-lactamase superfamily II)